jgi:hypothetical protein
MRILLSKPRLVGRALRFVSLKMNIPLQPIPGAMGQRWLAGGPPVRLRGSCTAGSLTAVASGLWRPARHLSPSLPLCRSSATTASPEASPSASEAATDGELPKNFDPAASEERLYLWWESCGHFQPSNTATGAPYVVAMPPPNVTGRLHMGHAMFATLQDIMVRFQRMRGRPTLWVPGTDHAGIATQMVVEKALAAKGQDRREMGREKFEAEVWSWKGEYGGFITGQLRRLGASCDWSRERFTLDQGLSGKFFFFFFFFFLSFKHTSIFVLYQVFVCWKVLIQVSRLKG